MPPPPAPCKAHLPLFELATLCHPPPPAPQTAAANVWATAFLPLPTPTALAPAAPPDHRPIPHASGKAITDAEFGYTFPTAVPVSLLCNGIMFGGMLLAVVLDVVIHAVAPELDDMSLARLDQAMNASSSAVVAHVCPCVWAPSAAGGGVGQGRRPGAAGPRAVVKRLHAGVPQGAT